MKIKDLDGYRNQEIESLLRRIPFFKELQSHNPKQLEILLRYSCLVELNPGETIMRRGDRGSWLYFLIKGRLVVYLDQAEEIPLSHITPGELFGDLALLCDHQRKATVAADSGDKHALLFATDFKPFGDLSDFSVVDLQTKLIFYRTMVHSIRWRLELKRMQLPAHPLAAEIRKVPTYLGQKETEQELESLFQQAKFLAVVLDKWNSEGVSIEDVVVANAANSS
jgi:hypothetical protein